MKHKLFTKLYIATVVSQRFILKAIGSMAFCLTILMTSQTIQAQSGLVSYWSGDGNANDVVGGNHGILQGAVTYAPGRVGQAFNLNGGYIEVPDSPSLSITGPLTIESWINPSSPNYQCIIEKYDAPGLNGYFLRLGPQVHASVCGDHLTGCNPLAFGATSITPGIWRQVAAVYDGTSVKIYLDGVLDGSIAATIAPMDGTTSLKIGARGDDANIRFGGLIDDVKIYNRALSPTEIQTNFNSASPMPTPTPSGFGGWDAVLDFSLNANPSGVWNYGYKPLNGQTFTPFDVTHHNNHPGLPGLPVDIWTRANFLPEILRNNSTDVLNFSGIVLPPDLLLLHPGGAGERSVLRWTAPATGTFQFQGRFQGLDNGNGPTTDVAIMHNNLTILFSEDVVGYGTQRPFSIFQQVIVGDTIDFSVGWGMNNYHGYDSTGLTVAVTQAPPINTDTLAPITSVGLNQNPNNAGWHNSDVVVSLNAADNDGGTGVKEIEFSATGATTIPPTKVPNSQALIPITAEGETAITYFARDNAGNAGAPQTFVVKIDKTAPQISASAVLPNGSPYQSGTWTNQNVMVGFTCLDPQSGVSGFTQPVTVTSEGMNQFVNGGCTDLAGNTANVTFPGISIDKTIPTVVITAPTGTPYLLNQVIPVNYGCSDVGSGIYSCSGTAPNGSNLNTGIVGSQTFTATAFDNAGNQSVPATVNYTVKFGIAELYDKNKAHKIGSTIPIKIKLVDAGNLNLSSASTMVHAVSVFQVSSETSPVLDDPGNSNPDFDFKYSADFGGYQFNLKTTNYQVGTYVLNFIVGNSPTLYTVSFQVR